MITLYHWKQLWMFCLQAVLLYPLRRAISNIIQHAPNVNMIWSWKSQPRKFFFPVEQILVLKCLFPAIRTSIITTRSGWLIVCILYLFICLLNSLKANYKLNTSKRKKRNKAIPMILTVVKTGKYHHAIHYLVRKYDMYI